ncbi:jg19684 [Pararge aegeria aegeria]|uniref:Jg19684 protein n=1 Tax=Pararge aegeria aegeria TaxID=348720 RepID=A0A8S4R5N2_9NEOP|nr:jg19684 [Pararge aegeria aegeria]
MQGVGRLAARGSVSAEGAEATRGLGVRGVDARRAGATRSVLRWQQHLLQEITRYTNSIPDRFPPRLSISRIIVQQRGRYTSVSHASFSYSSRQAQDRQRTYYPKHGGESQPISKIPLGWY